MRRRRRFCSGTPRPTCARRKAASNVHRAVGACGTRCDRTPRIISRNASASSITSRTGNGLARAASAASRRSPDKPRQILLRGQQHEVLRRRRAPSGLAPRPPCSDGDRQSLCARATADAGLGKRREEFLRIADAGKSQHLAPARARRRWPGRVRGGRGRSRRCAGARARQSAASAVGRPDDDERLRLRDLRFQRRAQRPAGMTRPLPMPRRPSTTRWRDPWPAPGSETHRP